MAYNPPKAYAHIPENELSYRHFLEYENLDEPLSERLARRDFEFYMIDTNPRIAKEYEGWRGRCRKRTKSGCVRELPEKAKPHNQTNAV